MLLHHQNDELENKMKTLEIVVKNAGLARGVAEMFNVEIVSEKKISVCTLMVLKGSFESLTDLNDELFYGRPVWKQYMNELMENK